MVTMFNQVNGRLDTMNERMDRMQAETNRRFDEMQAEMNRRFDRVDERLDQIFEALRVFEGTGYAPRRKSRYWPRKRRITSFWHRRVSGTPRA